MIHVVCDSNRSS